MTAATETQARTTAVREAERAAIDRALADLQLTHRYLRTNVAPDRKLSQVLTKIDEAVLWLRDHHRTL